MKMKGFWKKIIAKVLTAVMLVSVFSTVDMGWNVMKVEAAAYYTHHNWGEALPTIPGGLVKIYKEDTFTFNGTGYRDDSDYNECRFTFYYYDKGHIGEAGYATEVVNKTIARGETIQVPVECYCTSRDVGSGSNYIYNNFIAYRHNYNPVSYNWSNDGKSCTASRTCANSSNHKETETAKITSSVIKQATCTTVGTTRYTAKFNNSIFSQQTKDVNDIPKSSHIFSYSNSGNVITAKCSRSGCPYNTNGITLTLAANNATYTGSAYTGASIGNWSTGSTSVFGLAAKPAASSIKYYKQGESTALSGAPIDVGSYTAKLTVNGATATKDFEITKKNVAANDLIVTYSDSVYDGQSKSAQASAASGKTGMGEITVKYQKQNDSDWDEATTDAPVNAGTYKILISTSEGDNFGATTDLTDDAWKFTISKKPITINPDSGQEKYFGENDPAFTYTFIQSEFINEDDEITGAMGREPGEDVISGGYAYTTGTLTAGGNYKLKIADSAPKFMIKKLDTIAPPAPSEGYDLDYDEEKLSAKPATEYEIGKKDEDGHIVPISDPVDIEPGETYYVRYKDNDNHPASDWTPIHVAERPAAPAQSPVVERMDVNFTLQMIPGVEYSIDDGTTWFIATDADKNVTVSGGKITFSGLTPDTDYKIHSRVKATNTTPHGHETEQTVKTKKKLPDDLTTLFNVTLPTGEDLTYNKQPKEAEVSKKDPDQGIGDPIIKYYKIVDGEEVEVEKTTDAGEYIVKVSTPPTDDYPAVPETEIGRFTIAKKSITITPESGQSKVYGTADPVIKYTPSPALFTGDKFTGALTYTDAGVYTNVGTYTIVIEDLSAGNNYELNLTSGVTFEITKANHTSGPATGIGYTIDYVAETMTVISDADFELSSTETDVATALTDDKVTPGATYYIRYKESENQTKSPWTAITLPARPAAPNAVDKQETIENKKDAEITGVNSTMEYKFDGDADWTTVDGTTIANPENKNITIRVKASNDRKNFYGLEKNIEFTASETKLKVQIGGEIIEVPYGGTIPLANKPADPQDKPGKTFMYWEYNGQRFNFDDPDKTGDDNDATKVTGDIVLTPVYGVTIQGIITAINYKDITVELRAGDGKEYIGEVSATGDAGKYSYSVTALEGFDYNLVVSGKRVVGTNSDDITKTMLVNLTTATKRDVEMPASVFNSVVDREKAGEYSNTLVGGLDEMEKENAVADSKVEVKLIVSNTTNNHEDIKSEIKDSKVKLDFVELTLTKTVNDVAEDNFGDTNNHLIKIDLPFDLANKINIKVYRYHSDELQTLTETKNDNGEYIEVDSKNNRIAIHAMKFSTYAVGYNDKPAYSGYGGGSTWTEDGKDQDVESKVNYQGNEVYRLWNPKNGDHLLTTSRVEKDVCEKNGWRYEGVAFIVSGEGKKVYRLWNPRTGEHFYTTSEVEKNACVARGWKYEGVAFITDGTKEVYRLYSGRMHLFTIDAVERDNLINHKWNLEEAEFKAN